MRQYGMVVCIDTHVIVAYKADGEAMLHWPAQ